MADSFAKEVDRWEKLLANTLKNQAELPDLTAYRGPLEALMGQVKTRSAELQSRRPEALELQKLVREGATWAAKIRAALKAFLGYQNPKLLEYDIQPLPSRRRRRSGSPEAPEEPKPKNPAPAPTVSSTPQKS